MSSDRRKHRRQHVFYYSRLIDRESGRVIGHLLDMTRDGALMLSIEAMVPGEALELRMDLPEEVALRGSVDLSAAVVYCRQTTDRHLYEIGLELQAIAENDRRALEVFLAEYGIRED